MRCSATQLVFLLLAAQLGLAQNHINNLSGAVTTGFYSTHAISPRNQQLRFVPLTLDLDFAGYYGHPDFLSYDVRPVLTLGPQATEAGFIGGNGVSASATFLRTRSFPLRVFYDNIQREDVYYGALTQISGYRAINHNRNA
ncbi:MAG: hypothetical protein HZB13_15980, partial [Acidobacteria bacterium]|nr:hypothetical protein [Acidobacteriota bacterium]